MNDFDVDFLDAALMMFAELPLVLMPNNTSPSCLIACTNLLKIRLNPKSLPMQLMWLGSDMAGRAVSR